MTKFSFNIFIIFFLSVSLILGSGVYQNAYAVIAVNVGDPVATGGPFTEGDNIEICVQYDFDSDDSGLMQLLIESPSNNLDFYDYENNFNGTSSDSFNKCHTFSSGISGDLDELGDYNFTGIWDPNGNVNGTEISMSGYTIVNIASSDTDPPEGSISHNDDDGYLSVSTPVTITATFDEDMDPGTDVEISAYTNGSIGATAIMIRNSSTEYEYSFGGWGSDGPITFLFTGGKDLAGNTVVGVPTSIEALTADNTAPTLSAEATSSPNGFGWYNTTVTVEYSCDDSGSGPNPSSFSVNDIVSGDGENLSSLDQQCEDNVGNISNNAQVTGLNIDTTPPTISGSITPEPNLEGWNKDDAEVSWVCEDDTSGPDLATVTANSTQTTETSGTTFFGDCDDIAGNSAPQGSVVVMLDKTPPALDEPAPTTQRHETSSQNAALTNINYLYSTTDVLSGLADESCSDDDDVSTVNLTGGSFSKGITNVSCTATDVAGNTNSPTEFTIAIAEVTIDQICVTGVSTGGESCSAVSPDGVGITVMNALWGDPDLVTIRGTIYGYNTPTDVESLDIDWGTNDPGSDSIDTSIINSLDGDEDNGATFEFTHNYAGPGIASGAYTSNESIQVTMTGSTFTSNSNAEVSVQKHVTETTLELASASELWDHQLEDNIVTLNDTSEEPDVGVAGKTIEFSDPGVASGQNATTSDGGDSDASGTRTVTLQAGTAQTALDANGSPQDVTATFAGDDFYVDSSDTQSLILDPHIVTVDLSLAASSQLWDHTLKGNTVTLNDLNSTETDSGAALASGLELVSFTGDSVAVGQSLLLGPLVGGTNTTSVDLQAGTATAAQNGPTYNVTSTHSENSVYKGAASNAIDKDELTLDPHVIEVVSTIDSEVLWDHPFNVTTVITDLNFTGPDSGSADTVDIRIINYSGPGVAGENLQSLTADDQLIGGTATTGSEMLQAGNATDSNDVLGESPDDVISTIIDDFVYTGSASPATHTTQIDLRPHRTETSLDPLSNLVAGLSYTPSGIVTDLDRIAFNDPDMQAILGTNFVNYDTGSLVGEKVVLTGDGLDSPSLDAFMAGITIEDQNGYFSDNAYGIKVLNLSPSDEVNPGGKIILPEGSLGVTLDIRGLGLDDSATFLAIPSDENSSPFNVTVNGVDQFVNSTLVDQFGDPIDQVPDYVSALFAEADAIDSLELVSIDLDISIDENDEIQSTPGTSLEISEIRIEDPNGDPPLFLTINFGEVAASESTALMELEETGSITFVDGAFHNLVSTQEGVLEEGLEVTATFEGNDQYLDSSDTANFDTLFASWGFGVGNSATNVVSDFGTGFISIGCVNDIDGDGICNAVDDDGIGSYSTNTETLEYELPKGETGVGYKYKKKDIFLEIDWMEGHKPKTGAINQVIDAFQNSGVKNPTPDCTDCVNDGINIHYQLSDEIPHVAELNVWRDLDTDPTNDFNSIKAQYFGMPSERSVVNGTKSSSITIDGNAHDLQITGLKITTPPELTSVKGNLIVSEIIDFSADTDITLPTRIFWTPAAGQTSDFVFTQKQATFTIEDDFGDSSIKTLTATMPYLLKGPTTNVKDFDIGTISIQYTTADAVTASLVADNPHHPRITSEITDYKAQFTHYVLFAHSIGECGPSGISETDGNDIIVALGCEFGGLSETVDGSTTDANGNKNTLGTRNEQAATLMHELGHNLGIGHGGPIKIDGVPVDDSNVNCKPNYMSVMSYSRQDPKFLDSAIEGFPLDYSHGNADPIDETALDESLGFDTGASDGNMVFGILNDWIRASVELGNLSPIDWNGNGDTTDVSSDASRFDVNNFGISGCEASEEDEYYDHDDWNNLNFDFKGPGGSAFDGFKSDPRKTADLSSDIKDQIRNSGPYYTGVFDPVPSDGSGIFKIGSTIPFKFQVFTCKHVSVEEGSGNEDCRDVHGILGEPYTEALVDTDIVLERYVDEKYAIENGVDDDFVRHISALAFFVKPDSEGASEAVLLDEGEESLPGYIKYDPVQQQFVFTWDTKQLLDPDAKGKGKKTDQSDKAGLYALRFVVLEEGNTFLFDDNDSLLTPNIVPENALPEFADEEVSILVKLIP